jgi:hypothetical protein
MTRSGSISHHQLGHDRRGQGSRRNGENENTSTFVRTHSLILGGRERGAVAIVFVAADAAVALMLGSMGMS